MLSDVMEDYCKAIYELEQECGPPVRTSTIAEYLDVTSPTVTSMMESLEDRGLVAREKYAGVELTADGERVALEVIRHHRLIEAYLAEHLDYEWSEVHEEADVLEHHISENFEERVAAALDDPSVDPHGDPIPGADLEPLEDDDARPLSEFSPGQTVVVARVRDRDDEELCYLADAGIVPGRVLDITEVAPFGMYTVEHGDGEVHLPEEIATETRVYREDRDETPAPEEVPGV
ncbi:MAG: metal-dependent transcriptional regulator [Halanaeroarchaeum sp.]